MIKLGINWTALLDEYWYLSFVLVGALLLIIVIRYFVKKRNKLKAVSLSKQKTTEQQKNASGNGKHTNHDPYFSRIKKRAKVRAVVTK
ncbi:MAG: hypothetical protein NT068_03470 [Candidatus Nomurabacteria bacterium]|nr:hypothetical protein [Candidatus Nomurabacteria bacterium]